MYRSQDESGDPENNPEYGTYLWQDNVNELYWFSQMPVIDLECDQEWDDAGIIARCTIDFKKVWVPWDSSEISRLQVSNAMFYEKEMRVRAEAKLSQWQVWWQANGRNQFSELPPLVPPPPPLPAPASAPAEGPPAPNQVPTTNLIKQLQRAKVAKGPQPPPFPPPHMATASAAAAESTEASAPKAPAATKTVPTPLAAAPSHLQQKQVQQHPKHLQQQQTLVRPH